MKRSSLAVSLLVLLLAACGGGSGNDQAERLPHVLAPVETTGVQQRGEAVLTGDTTSAAWALQAERWQVAAPDPRWPRSDRLSYVRYRNDAYGFGIAYPDTLLKPRAEIGGNHGREFASSDGRAVALVYAVEDAGLQSLDAQFQGYLEEAGLRITYRVREENWFVVAGYRGGRKFYEKTLLRGRVLKTFQIQYDSTRAAYFDVVAATMGTSFKG